MSNENIFQEINRKYIPLIFMASWCVFFLFFSVFPRDAIKKLLDSPLPLIISGISIARVYYSFVSSFFRKRPDLSRFESNQLVQFYAGKTLFYSALFLVTANVVAFFVPLGQILTQHMGSSFLLQAFDSFMAVSWNAIDVVTGFAGGLANDISEFLFGPPPTPSQEEFLQGVKDPSVQETYRDRLDTWYKTFAPNETIGGWVVEKTIDTGSYLGAIMRTAFPSMDIIKEEGPLTQAFFKKTDSFTGSEMDVIRQTYEAVSAPIQFVQKGTEGNMRDSETVLSTGQGVCREQAALLNTALQRHGIDSEIISMPTQPGKEGHIWVQVETDQYGKLWLDPTNFDSFMPIVPR